NRVIGAGGRLPWHVPEDFKWFKSKTTGHVVVMGRKTFEALGKPLPDRINVVLSRSGFKHAGALTIQSLTELAELAPGREVFICGGAEVYRHALPLCSELYLTVIKRVVEGDAFFPPFEHQFKLVGVILDQPEFKILHYKNCAVGLT
ncbi:MAG: dihydrofolate reductase, partial [Verrucomicrobiae bacterium]|nr:dihydrofolate reductase [Verrucomicrobiae bacterium]